MGHVLALIIEKPIKQLDLYIFANLLNLFKYNKEEGFFNETLVLAKFQSCSELPIKSSNGKCRETPKLDKQIFLFFFLLLIND